MNRSVSSNRIMLLGSSLLVAYQIAVGIEGLGAFAVFCYSVGFGILLVAGLLWFILGDQFLETAPVVVFATLVPLSLAVGLVSEFYPRFTGFFLGISCLGFLMVVFARTRLAGTRWAVAVLASTHGIAGMVIFILPIWLSLRGQVSPAFTLIGIGGGLMGVMGILLVFLRIGHLALEKERIFAILPFLLLATMLAFVAGYYLR